MSSTLKDLTSQALTLPRRSRALLAELLLDSLDEEPVQDHTEAWLALARQRDEEITAGHVETFTHEDAMARARKALRCPR